MAAIAAVCERPELRSKVYDVACEEQLSYRDLMARTSTALGLSRHFLSVPFFSPGFSRLWVSVVTGAPRALVKPPRCEPALSDAGATESSSATSNQPNYCGYARVRDAAA